MSADNRDAKAPGSSGQDAFEIVINYRREDTSGHAGHLYDELSEPFGSEHVFMDIDAIDPGADFGEVIARAVERCQAFIALIGKSWLTATDARGRRRLDNPDDFVRIEIETALQHDIRVIPVLVQGVEMPSSEDLPPSLRPLVRRNALEIRDTSWRYDVDRLIDTLKQFAGREIDQPKLPPGPPLGDGGSTLWAGKRVALVAAGALLLLVAAIGAVLLTRDGGDPKPKPPIGRPSLLFAAARPGRVYAVTLSGTNKVDLTRGRGRDETPAWSPDHKRIALARDSHIWIVRRDGSDGKAVTNGVMKDGSPEWSPDGQRIAFDRKETTSTYDVWVRNADGSEVNLTPSPTVTGGSPDWSPTGSRIVFQRRTKLWLMRSNGSELKKVPVAVPPGTILHPAWSPDGSQIAFTLRAIDSRSDIWLVDPRGKAPRNLTEGRLKFPDGATWSPDSLQLVVAARDGLWLIGRDGELGREPLTRGVDLMSPAWAP